MLNALMGIGSKVVNTSSTPISGLLAARKLEEEADTHEKRGDLDKAKECFKTGIRKAEDLHQRNLNESELGKIREQLAASYFYYGNFLLKCGDEFNADANYKKALEHAPYIDLDQADTLKLYNQISAQYSSFLAQAGKVSQGDEQPGLTKVPVEHWRPSKLTLIPVQRPQSALSIQEKSEMADYLFETALLTLGSLDVSNKPRLFLVYAHDNKAHGKAEASTSKYLIEKLSQIQVALYSDQTPMGQPYSSSVEGRRKGRTLDDILTSQLCLLPDQLRDDVKPVDQVVVCCSEVLGSYLKWPDYKKFYQALCVAYREDREAYLKVGKPANARAIREVVRQFSQEEDYKAGFHHVLTEIAFLQIRAGQPKDHGIIPVLLTPNSYEPCLAHFIGSTTVRMEDIPRFEEGAQAGQEVYLNQGRHIVLFKLIERVLADSNEASLFLKKFWQGYSDFILHLKNGSSSFGPLEFARQINDIFGSISLELFKKIASTAQQFSDPVWQQGFMQRLIEVLSQEEQKKAFQTISQPLARLGEDIEQFKQAYEKTLQSTGERDVLSMYVPVRGIKKGPEGEETVDLEAELERFFASEATVFLLQGVAGTGKSTFNRHLALKKLEEYQHLSKAQNDPPLVFFVELRNIDNPNKQVIQQFLQSKGFALEQIEALRTHSHQRCIFIFDGYDEIKGRNSNFYDLNELWGWERSKFVITSRPEYLDPNYQTFFRPKGAHDGLREAWMAPFSSEQRSHYIENYVNQNTPLWTVEQYEQALNQLSTLGKELERPIVLRMLLQILPELGEKGQTEKALTLGAVYEQYFQQWWANWRTRLGAIKLTSNEEDAKQELCERKGGFIRQGFAYMQNCAVELTKVGLTFVKDSDDFEKRHDGIYKAFFADETKAGDAARKRLLRFNAPFQIQQNQHYAFSHKSMQEYLVARAICTPGFKAIEASPKDVLNQLSLVKEPVILDFLVEQVKGQAQFKAQLYAWIEASKASDAPMTVGAANAITILVRAGERFIGADLQGIRIPGADLSYGVFDRTQFEGADLSRVTLLGAWLCDVNMCRANLEDVEFGEMPALEVGSWAHGCSYSLDGKWLAVGTSLGGGKLYRLEETKTQQNKKLKLEHTLGGFWGIRPPSVSGVVFSPDSRWLAVSDFGRVKLWSVETGKAGPIFGAFADGTVARNFTFSADGQWLAAGFQNNVIKLWETQTGQLKYTLEGHENWVHSVSISLDRKWLASGGKDKTLRLWELNSAEVVLRQTLTEHNGEVNSVAFSPDGKWLASGGDDRTIKLWELESSKLLLRQTLEGHEGLVASVSFSSCERWFSPENEKWLASGSLDRTVKLWRFKNSETVLRKTFEGHNDQVLSTSFSPDNKWLVSGGLDKAVKLWRLGNNGVLPHNISEEHNAIVWSVLVSKDGKWLASGSADKTIKLWELGSRGALLRQTLTGHNDKVVTVSISSDGRWLASGSSDKTVKLWNLESEGRAVLHQTLEGHDYTVWGTSISSDNQWLASGSGDKTIKLWKLSDSGALLQQTLEGHSDQVRGISFSPDSKWLVSGSSDKTVKVWELNGEEASLCKTLVGHERDVFSVAISPNNKWLVSGSFDGTMRLWELNSTEVSPSQIFKGHKKDIVSVSFSPDSKWLASGSHDRTVKIWSLDTGKCKATIQGFITTVHSVAWQEFTEDLAKIVIGGSQGTMRIFQLKREENSWKSNLYWTSNQNQLCVGGMLVQGALNLSQENKDLIAQRQKSVDAIMSIESNALSMKRRNVLLNVLKSTTKASESVIRALKDIENLESNILAQGMEGSNQTSITAFPGAFPERAAWPKGSRGTSVSQNETRCP